MFAGDSHPTIQLKKVQPQHCADMLEFEQIQEVLSGLIVTDKRLGASQLLAHVCLAEAGLNPGL